MTDPLLLIPAAPVGMSKREMITMMKNLTGQIRHLRYGPTRFGFRAQARLERVDWSTGEVTTHIVVAWEQTARDMVEVGLLGEMSATGYAKEDPEAPAPRFNAKRISRMRRIAPATADRITSEIDAVQPARRAYPRF